MLLAGFDQSSRQVVALIVPSRQRLASASGGVKHLSDERPNQIDQDETNEGCYEGAHRVILSRAEWGCQCSCSEKQDHPRGAPGWYTFAINFLKSASYQLRSGQNRTRTAFSCKIQTSAWHPRSGDRGQERGIISDDHRADFLQAIQDSLRSQRKAVPIWFPRRSVWHHRPAPRAFARSCTPRINRLGAASELGERIPQRLPENVALDLSKKGTA